MIKVKIKTNKNKLNEAQIDAAIAALTSSRDKLADFVARFVEQFIKNLLKYDYGNKDLNYGDTYTKNGVEYKKGAAYALDSSTLDYPGLKDSSMKSVIGWVEYTIDTSRLTSRELKPTDRTWTILWLKRYGESKELKKHLMEQILAILYLDPALADPFIMGDYNAIEKVSIAINKKLPVTDKLTAFLHISELIATKFATHMLSLLETLKEYFLYKETPNILVGAARDTHSIKTAEQLVGIVAAAKRKYNEYLIQRSSSDAEAGTELLFSDNGWDVYIAKNHAASCKLGKDTVWCTSAPGVPEHFKNHSSERSPLFIFINKKYPKEKYAFSFLAKEFKDAKNDNIDNKLFDELKELLFLHKIDKRFPIIRKRFPIIRK